MKELFIFGEKIDGINYTARQGSYAVIFDERKEKVGVIKTKNNKYFLPGGGIEGNETHEECLIREAREEMGTEIGIGEFIGRAGLYFYSTNQYEYFFAVGNFYLCSMGDYVCEPLDENEVFQWLDIETAIKQLFLEHQTWAVKQALCL